MLIVQQNNNTIMCRFCKSLSVFFLVQKLASTGGLVIVFRCTGVLACLRRPASAGSTWCHPPVRRGNWVVQGGLPQQGALKKENNPSQAPLWARPPKYMQYGAPEDVIQVFSLLLRQAAGYRQYSAPASPPKQKKTGLMAGLLGNLLIWIWSLRHAGTQGSLLCRPCRPG